MGHKNKKSLIWQTQERLDSMLAIGQSKYEDKKLDLTERKIYSWNTYKSYLQTLLPVRQVLPRQSSL